ncbi:hypothetical protein AB0I93_20610 [Streptomyces sp. NPDC049967]|uniref:hypothetical protein n=1 Tax=unclassified Streptomyces TaxID=2593676 RepID=UPI003449DF9C
MRRPIESADPNDSVDVLGIFGDAFADVVKSPFVFLGDAQDAFTGENGGASAFLDKYLPVRPRAPGRVLFARLDHV